MSKENNNMADLIWPEAAPDGQFESACAQTHSAMQWLARMVNSYCVPASDGSHLHLDWLGTGCTFRTCEIAPDTKVEMRLPELELQFVEGGVPTKHVVELDDKSPAEIEAWTLIELLHRGIDRDKYAKDLPYDVSGLLSGDARHYETLNQEAGFQELTDWLCLTADVIGETCKKTDHSALKLDPDSFSLFTRLSPDNGRPAVGNHVEFGFRAGRPEADGACFYVKCVPLPQTENRPELRAPAQWLETCGDTAVMPTANLRSSQVDAAELIRFFSPPSWLSVVTS